MDVGDLYWESVIPTAANNPGRFGAHYKTRVVIFNPTERDYSITARLYDGTGLVRREEIQIDANRYYVWDNFLKDEPFAKFAAGQVVLPANLILCS